MRKLSGLSIYNLVVCVLSIIAFFLLNVFADGDTFRILTIALEIIVLIFLAISVAGFIIRKKNDINILTDDLEPEKLINHIKKWGFLYTPYRREMLLSLLYQAIERYDLSLEIVSKIKRGNMPVDYYLSFLDTVDFCKCYIGMNEREQAEKYLNLAREMIKNIEVNERSKYMFFTLNQLERSYALRFDDTFSDYEYYEKLLDPNSQIAPKIFYSNYNIVIIHNSLAKLYLRLGMTERANINFKYVADYGKNLPCAIRARNYLQNGIIEGI